MRIYINGKDAAGDVLRVAEIRPFVVRLEPEDPEQLTELTLTSGGVKQEEGAIPPSRPGGWSGGSLQPRLPGFSRWW